MELHDLPLSSDFLETLVFRTAGVKLPFKVKYGRMGALTLRLPNVFKIGRGIIEAVITDFHVVLTPKAPSDWYSEVDEKSG